MSDYRRPQVGPADPATRKTELAKRLAEREPAGLYGARTAKKTVYEPHVENPTADLSVGTAAKRIRGRKGSVDKAVEDAS